MSYTTNLDIWYERDSKDTCIIKMRRLDSNDEPFAFILVHNDNKYKHNLHQLHTLKGIAELLGVPNIEERACDTSPITNLMLLTDK